MSFQPAVRGKVPGKVMLYGVAGSGKTLWALKVARGLVGPEGRIALADTEAGTASIYANQTQFDHLEINPPFSPTKVVAAINLAERENYDVLIIDSLSHFWNGPGGVLSIVDTDKRGWAAGSPAHDTMIQAILRARIDIVVTARAKMETVMEKGVPRKVGLTYIQRADSLEYEVGWIGYIDHNTHTLKIDKQRGMPDLDGAIVEPTQAVELGARIAAWLRGEPA